MSSIIPSDRPLQISICIPHYNRVTYLLAVLESICSQDYAGIEVVISDDCSTDSSATAIPEFVAQHADSKAIRFRYQRNNKNVGYDRNLRTALGAGRGDYLLILGNDDALAGPRAISELVRALRKLDDPEVFFTNFLQYGSSDVVIRSQQTRIIGAGPEVAVSTFRSFSFVGGIGYKRSAFLQHNTDKHDRSVYVQIYLAARCIAAGGRVAGIAEPVVAKDVIVDGKGPNSYLDVLGRDNQTLVPKTGGLDQVGLVACDAILPMVAPSERSALAYRVYRQLLALTYPVWLYTYRQHGVYAAAINLALGCVPARLVRTESLTTLLRLRLYIIYAVGTIAGLFFPLRLLAIARSFLKRRTLR